MKRLPLSVRYLLRIYIIGIILFTFFRLILFAKNWQAVQQMPVSITLGSLFMGFRFDTVISGYLLALPIVMLTIAEYGRFLFRRVLLAVHIFLCVLYTVAFFGCAADIPFFLNYNNRLNYTVLNWTGSPVFMIKMVTTQWSYLIYFILFVILAVVFTILTTKQYKRFVPEFVNGAPKTKYGMLAVSILAMGLVMLGIRGRIEKKAPIMVGTAYFSSYDFANQAGLNPVFTFMKSCLEANKEANKTLHLMDDKQAIEIARQYLHADTGRSFPIAHKVIDEEAPEKNNVVLVIMESMSASFLHHTHDALNLTPVLDSLAEHGYYFSNFYSAGIHTFNGIFSTLYSFPALMARHSMIGAYIPHYTGIPYVMKQYGYETMYFTTHDEQFDNAGGFLTGNNVDHIFSQKDYPDDKVLSTLGVPDHYLYDFTLPVFDKCYARHKPFFATIMTGSNHAPYVIPEDIPFKPKTDVRDGTVEYADWSVGHFISEASKHPWFSNTIFVFVGDHGAYELNGNDGFDDMPYSFNHVPLIIYSSVLKDAPRLFRQPGGQIDIGPILFGLLHFSYTNNTMGQDILQQPRLFMYCSSDDKIGVADTTHFYIWHIDGREALFSFSNRTDNIINSWRTKADSMKQYAQAMIQASQWLLLNNKTGPAK